MGDKEKAEELLSNYRKLRGNIETDLHSKYAEYSLDSLSFVETRGEKGSITSEVERYVENKYSLDDDIVIQIRICKVIEGAFKSLNEEGQNIIAQLYFEGKSVSEVAHVLDWTRPTIYRKRNEAIDRLIELGLLKAWSIYRKLITEQV